MASEPRLTETLLALPAFHEMCRKGLSTAEAKLALHRDHGISAGRTTIRHAYKRIRAAEAEGRQYVETSTESLFAGEEAPQPAPFRKQLLGAQVADYNPGPLTTPEDRIREQLVWAQRAKVSSHTGGKFTLVFSDLHFGDRAHMHRSLAQMIRKSLLLMEQYEPDEITLVSNGDAVAGRGIYRNQAMDAVYQTAEDQLKVAAFYLHAFYTKVKERLPKARVRMCILNGNHDRAMDEPLSPSLNLKLRGLGVDSVFLGDTGILNLADQGEYLLYLEHGYGYSKTSPSAPSWLNDVRGKLLRWSQRGRAIKRVTHGHTHWCTVGLEHGTGFIVDTTGGCQRNERVKLGQNQRPLGFIAYVSPRGFDGILSPIPVQPDTEIQEQDIDDLHLQAGNMVLCSEALIGYSALEAKVGATCLLEPEGR